MCGSAYRTKLTVLYYAMALGGIAPVPHYVGRDTWPLGGTATFTDQLYLASIAMGGGKE